MSDIDSLSAPDWHWYSRPAVLLGDGVGELVGGDVEARGVAVAEHHLGPVPVGVAHRRARRLAEVDRRDQLAAGVVVGVAAERLGVVVEDLAEVVVDRVGLGVAGRGRRPRRAAGRPGGRCRTRRRGPRGRARRARRRRASACGTPGSPHSRRAGDLADRALDLDRDLRVHLRAEQRGDHHRHQQQPAHVLGGDLAGGAREAGAEHARHARGAPRAPTRGRGPNLAGAEVPSARGTGRAARDRRGAEVRR